MVDASPNGNDGVYFPTAAFGLASPIETDAGSKAIGGPVGKLTIAAAPDSDVRDVFTWLAWGYHSSAAIFNETLLCRSGEFGLGGSSQIGFASNSAYAALSISGTDYELSHSVLSDTWYFLAFTRNGNVMRLYVNGILRAERTDLALGDISADNWGSDGWYIGRAQNTGFAFHSAATDEVALCAAVLTASEIQEIYEAALADLPMSATITVRVVVDLDTDDVEAVDFPFTHNFAEALSGSPRPIVEHLSWKTNDLRSQPDFSQRINAQPHHVERTLEYFVTPTSARARAMLQSALWTPGQTYKLPIAKDWGVLTSQATAGADTVSLDTTIRDYEIGSHLVVWEDVYQPWTAQFFEITSRTDTELGITPNVGDTLPAGSPLMPARLAILPEDSLSVDSHLIDRETHAFQFEILSTELSSRRVTEYTPSQTYKDIEVFSLERAKVEWVDPSPYQISRRFQQTGTPTGNDYSRAIDTGSPQTVPIRVLLTSRQAISEFYGWMDARQGKQNPVWIVSEESDLQVTARSSAQITIENIGYAARYNTHSARRYIAFKKTDGSLVYRKITAAIDNGSTETLSLDLDPPVLAQIVKVSFLKLCTAPDQFELKYHRDGDGFIAECDFVFSELLTTPE